MEPAFWDSSSLVPLCIHQQSSGVVRSLIHKYRIVVWWATPVEVKGAFSRLLRTGNIDPGEFKTALVDLDQLRHSWRELQPDLHLRGRAESLMDQFPLKAADALQLAAALAWCNSLPSGRAFISGDSQLLDAARQLGFQVIAG